eukprot:694755-Amorphochlora_amoeboformis.AAC.1
MSRHFDPFPSRSKLLKTLAYPLQSKEPIPLGDETAGSLGERNTHPAGLGRVRLTFKSDTGEDWCRLCVHPQRRLIAKWGEQQRDRPPACRKYRCVQL